MGVNVFDDEVIENGAKVALRYYHKGEYLSFNPSFRFERWEDRYVLYLIT